MTRAPEPRPALTRSADGGLHPAAPQAAAPHHLHPAPHAPAVPPAPPADPEPPPAAEPQQWFKPGDLRARKAAGSGKGGRPPKPENRVSLDVKVSKKLRKAVRRKAEAEGWSADDAVSYVLQAWVES